MAYSKKQIGIAIAKLVFIFVLGVLGSILRGYSEGRLADTSYMIDISLGGGGGALFSCLVIGVFIYGIVYIAQLLKPATETKPALLQIINYAFYLSFVNLLVVYLQLYVWAK